MGNKSMSSTRPPTKNYGVTTTLKSYRSPINSPVLSIDIANVNGPLQPIFTPSKHIEKISSDDGTTVFVTNDGCLYIIKDTISEPTLIRMHGDSRVVEARVGFSRIIAIMEDGTAQARGTNQYSSLGLDGDAAEMTPLPTQNYGNERLILSSNMYSSALVISEASNVYIFGQTWFEHDHNYSVNKSKKYNVDHITKDNKRIIDVASGAFHAAILNNAGEVFTGGSHSHGRLGRVQATKLEGFIKIDTNHIYTSITCNNDSTALGTKLGEVFVYGQAHNQSYMGKQLANVGEPVKSIIGTGNAAKYAITTASRRIFVIPINNDGGLCTEITGFDARYDYAVGNILLRQIYYCFLPQVKRHTIEIHFSLMKKAVESSKCQDITVVCQH